MIALELLERQGQCLTTAIKRQEEHIKMFVEKETSKTADIDMCFQILERQKRQLTYVEELIMFVKKEDA